MLLVLVLWANYFWEVQRAQLKATELARFVAFERTVRPDVDAIAAEAHERYKDLDGSTKTGALGMGYRNRLSVSVKAQDTAAPLTHTSLTASGAVAGISSMAGTALRTLGETPDDVARKMGLDTRRGAVEVEVQLVVENGIIPYFIALYTTGFMGQELNLKFTERFLLFHDTWRAWEYRDHPGDTLRRVEQHTHARITHGSSGGPIVYAGVGSGPAGGGQRAIDGVLTTLRLDTPFSATYIRDSVLIKNVPDEGKFEAATGTRTAPGDILQAAYWVNDEDWCFGTCEPRTIQHKRGLINGAGRGDNWPMRAYNCRGPYFQGATKSEAPEALYSESSDAHDPPPAVPPGDYHNYGGAACAP
ncbi:pilus assembly protein [Pyxidicoccus trucidator]|uniref:pilus assembly protein n=1 Tax=Pyxidicoccus trucidator TaxID=2709662 RepID=UPI00196703AE|nr:pilus assembly protein [Pyxidicoccus trucidator]